MSRKIEKLLHGEGGNYIFPFFWQHGEDEATLREYMRAIDESHLKAVCVESRPHPDFCGPKWWTDMDIILDEARKRHMQVWILDDSHFPTGFANGAMESQPVSLRRQSIVCSKFTVEAGNTLTLTQAQIRRPKPFEKSMVEQFMIPGSDPVFEDERLLALYAFRTDVEKQEQVNLMPRIEGDRLDFTPEEGRWEVCAVHTSRNFGPHRSYINMMEEVSCRVLIDAVYEPHYAHYAADFGTTIAGFFSDEPELGNGHLYDYEDPLGADVDFPWSAQLEAEMHQLLGTDYEALLPLLWRGGEDPATKDTAAKVRWQYMNAVTRLVQKDFSEQLGTWCRAHGVQYIGHLIEDDNHHSRTGCSLGHYFRGLAGQDMAGIDDIGGQVFPQGEDLSYNNGIFRRRNGEFYHYTLAKLASSAAAIEPRKKGNSMCEIFGNYGWSEGVRLEKYLADHFMVNGVNHYVPHAFSAAPYPDPDCPPHFYAHGHNPQYRHFGALMNYMNRVCELISDGRHIAQAAVIYSAEGDWTGTHAESDRNYMDCDPVIRSLYDAQIDCDIIPQDVFADPAAYGAKIADGVLKVSTQEYRMVFVPQTPYITKAFAQAVPYLAQAGVPVYFAGAAPQGICDTPPEAAEADAELIRAVNTASDILTLKEIRTAAMEGGLQTVQLSPADDRIRCLHYVHADGTQLYYFVNEGTAAYEGTAVLPGCESDEPPGTGMSVYAYDAWANTVYDADTSDGALPLYLEPLKSLIIVLDPAGRPQQTQADPAGGTADEILRRKAAGGSDAAFAAAWKRSICEAIFYPAFADEKELSLPDHLEEERPTFSGFVRYENCFEAAAGDSMVLEITDAHEGVEVFLNGESLGLQVVPVCRYDLTGHLKDGVNDLCIEVATTLERERSVDPDPRRRRPAPSALSGITGTVRIRKL